jgi:hypothetical protein
MSYRGVARAVINEADDERLLKDVMQGASVEVDVADFLGAFEPIWALPLQHIAGPGGHLNKGNCNDSLGRQPH